MLGRLLNTLTYRLRQRLRDWRKKNETIRESAWPFYQRALVAASEHPVRFPLSVLIVVLAICGEIWGLNIVFDRSVENIAIKIQLEQRLYSLWTVQATIAAIVYPIVISFVSLLLQRRHSDKAKLHVYLHDSAAVLTGLSALFLVAVIGAQYLLISKVDSSTLTFWLGMDGLWFLANILGVIWFLHRTFEYLRPERRAHIIRMYAINQVWPEEVRRNLEYNIFIGAIHYGWLPGTSFGSKNNNAGTEVLFGHFGRGMGELQVSKKKRGKWIIQDVRFRLLSWVVKSWVESEKKVAGANENTEMGFSNSPLLIFPSLPGVLYEREIQLCRAKRGRELYWWEQWLVRISFPLVKGEENATNISIEEILNGLATEVLVAMEVGEETVFRETLDELVELHVTLIKSGEFYIEGRKDNFANLVNRNHVFEARIYDLWAREYRRLLEAAVQKLPVNDTFFGTIIYLPNWLLGRLVNIRPVSIPKSSLNISLILHYRLSQWWSRTVEEQGQTSHGVCESIILKAPALKVYESAIKGFVGAWGSQKNDHFPSKQDEFAGWDDCREIAELYVSHLENTTDMLFDSLTLGNKEGAEWICDFLVKWWATLYLRFEVRHYSIRDDRYLTLGLLTESWEEASNVIDLVSRGIDQNDGPGVVWAACIHNYWIDVCCVSIYTMLQLGKSCPCEQSLPAELVVHLGHGKPLRPGDSVTHDPWPIRTIEDLLIAIYRQSFLDNGYRIRLNSVVERIAGQGKPSMVPGRIYSGSGSEDLNDLLDGQLIFLCLLVKQGWAPSGQIVKIIRKWGLQDDESFRAFSHTLNQWKERLGEAEFSEADSVYSCIRDAFDGEANFDQAIAALVKGLDQLITDIEGFRLDLLRDASVSDKYLSNITKWSSQSGFDRENGCFPISMFSEVVYSAEKYAERSMLFREMDKAEFVEPPMSQRAFNQDEWFDETVSRHVAGSVLAEALRILDPTVVDVDTQVAYWKQIEVAASRIRNERGDPILLVTNGADPKWLLDWRRSRYDDQIEMPQGLSYQRDKRFQEKEYIGSLNDIPVFKAPLPTGASFLISKYALSSVKFTEFKDRVFVRSEYFPTEGKEAYIDLKLTWCFSVELLDGESLQLRYTEQK